VTTKKNAKAPPDAGAASRRKGYAIIEVNRCADLYNKTGNGWFAWKAWRALRAERIKVPESLLAVLDAMAEKLLDAKSAREVADALGMGNVGRTKKLGGAAGEARARQHERVDRIIREVTAMLELKRLPREKAYEAAAHNLRQQSHSSYPSDRYVKDVYLAFLKARRPVEKGTAVLDKGVAIDVLATFGRK
jgi:hypothetical protein